MEYKETGRKPVYGEKKIGRHSKCYDEREAQIVKATNERYRFGAQLMEYVIRKQYKVCI
jgi:putative transposase